MLNNASISAESMPDGGYAWLVSRIRSIASWSNAEAIAEAICDLAVELQDEFIHCEMCGVGFTPTRPWQRRCSYKCTREYNKLKARAKP